MTIAFWLDEYKTGNQEIDEQHKNLFNIINKLHNAMMRGCGKHLIDKTLEELIIYTIEHFENEEKIMLAHQYPDFIAHKNKHDYLTEKVKNLHQKLKNGDILINREVIHFLNEWLIHHIKGEDRKLIKFLQHKNSLAVIS